MFERDPIHIVFLTDENFALPTGVALASLAKNRDIRSQYKIYILCNNVSAEMKSRLLSQSADNFSIQVMDLDGFDQFVEMEQKTEHVSKTALFKFLFPNLFPDIDKLLYLDGDILILQDLYELYSTDMDRHYVAAVKDMAPVLKYKPHVGKKLNLPDTYTYFNSGVMLFNLKMMREHGITERLIAYRQNGINHFMDQDAFNVVLGARVKVLPVKYNNEITIHEQFSVDKIAEFHEMKRKDIGKRCVKDAVILHLTSKKKPWKYYLPYYTDLFQSYQAQSAFADIELNFLPLVEPEKMPTRKELVKKVLKTVKKEGLVVAIKKIRPWLSKHKQDPKLRMIYRPYKTIKNRISRTKLWYSEGKILKEKCQNALYDGPPRERKIIMSMTSFPGRVHDIPTTMLPLLQQTVKPDRIILWLTNEEFPNKEKGLPRRLTRLKEYGVEICWGENLRAHTKYFHVMQTYPEDIVVTVDDDIHYDYDLVETLYNSYLKHPNAVSAARVHLMTFTPAGELEPYTDWKYQYCEVRDIPMMALFATGVGGVLYPPHCMHPEVFNKEHLKQFALANDDIWMKFMQVINDTPVVFAGETAKLRFVGESQEVGLCWGNVQGGGNDVIVQALVKQYNHFGDGASLLSKMNGIDYAVCPVCNSRISLLAESGCEGGRVFCECCGSDNATRLFALYLKNKTNLFKASKKRILHFEPDKWLGRMLSRPEFKHDYYPISADPDFPGYIRATGEMTKIPFSRDTFDVLINCHKAQDIGTETTALHEMKRVLKKGATAFIKVPEYSVVQPETEESPETTVSYEELLKTVGFRVQKINYMTTFPESVQRLFMLPDQDEADAIIYLCKK